MKAMGSLDGKKQDSRVDFRAIRYKGLNKIVTTGWATLVVLISIPFYIYTTIQTSGADRLIVITFFPIGITILAVVSAQLVVLVIFFGLRLNKLVFRKNS